MKPLLTTIIILAACGSNKPYEGDTELLAHLQKAQAERMSEALTYVDENGWIVGSDCDGMIPSAKFGVFHEGFNPYAAEYPNEPGRFNRSPSMCREGDERSRSTWSGDMGVCGLVPYAWLTGDRQILESHISYVLKNDGHSGEPRSLDITFYSPQLVGLVFSVIHKLGGADVAARHVPPVYVAGLTDYRAHLQMCDIFVRSELKWQSPEMSLIDVTDRQLARIEEHAAREPHNPFYQYMFGLYTGNFEPAIELCLDPSYPVGDYVRCDEPRACQLAESTWSCGLLIRHLERG